MSLDELLLLPRAECCSALLLLTFLVCCLVYSIFASIIEREKVESE